MVAVGLLNTGKNEKVGGNVGDRLGDSKFGHGESGPATVCKFRFPEDVQSWVVTGDRANAIFLYSLLQLGKKVHFRLIQTTTPGGTPKVNRTWRLRIAGNPLQSHPGQPLLLISLLAAVAIATGLPYTVVRALLLFTPLPLSLVGTIVILAVTYLLLVQAVKFWPYRRFWSCVVAQEGKDDPGQRIDHKVRQDLSGHDPTSAYTR